MMEMKKDSNYVSGVNIFGLFNFYLCCNHRLANRQMEIRSNKSFDRDKASPIPKLKIKELPFS